MSDEANADCSSSSQVTGECSESTIEINVKTLDSQIYTFRVNKDLPVSMLREKIVSATGVPVEQQRLIFRGRVLKDDHLLSAYQLEDGHTLHLVAREPVQAQPTPGTDPEDAARNNGNGSTGPPRGRVGQVSRSVVLGTINIAEPVEGLTADIGRVVSAILGSFGVRNLAPTGGASNAPSVTVGIESNQSPSSVETDGTQNGSGRNQPSNAAHPGFTILNHPFPSPQIPLFSALAAIPDSLTTLSEFISRMELALQYSGSQSSQPTNVQDHSRSEVPSSNMRGLPTPEALGVVIERVRHLITTNAAAALSHIVGRLEREGASTDPMVRGQIQSEAMHLGVAMQHLGAMFLELGRTIMTLHMGQSPTEALVNAGPAVYISPTGPNPIMVQPFSLQTSSLFGVPSPSLFNGVSGPSVAGEPSRNVNIHIHAGTSVAPGLSSVAARANLGEATRSNAEQASVNGNASRASVPMRGLSSRTVVADIPTRSAAEAGSRVRSMTHPVTVRCQQSFPNHSTSAQASPPTVSSVMQPNVPQPSLDSSNISTFVADLNAHIANVHAANTEAQISSIPSLQSDTQLSHPTMGNGAQPNMANPFSRTPLETDTTATVITHLSAQSDELSLNDEGQSFSPSIQCTDTPCPREGSQLVPQGSMLSGVGTDDGNYKAVGLANTEASEGSGSGKSQVLDTGMPGNDRQQENLLESSASKSSPEICQAGDTLSSKMIVESSQNNSDSIATSHTSRSIPASENNNPAPLGLGLGGLQPKRRGKPSKPIARDNVSRVPPSTNQNPQSIAMGQQVLQSLVSQNSDQSRVNTDASSIPLPSVFTQIMDGMPMVEQSAFGQVDGNMISHALQNPALNNLLAGIGEQAGLGSPATLSSMMEQCTQRPGIMNTVSDLVQQVVQSDDIRSTISGFERGNGGLDLSRMIQQMMPIVSQAIGRGLTNSDPLPGLQPGPRTLCHDDTDGVNMILDGRNSQIDVQQAVERIEHHDSPGSVFHEVLESASNLLGEGNIYGDLVEELCEDAGLINEYMEMLEARMRRSS